MSTISNNMTAKFTSVPVPSAETEFLAQIGLSGDATHVAAALLALFAIKAVF